ncbi:MAG TPA: TorF family putative porin [Burkholderiales bacterium]|nr:TorF family putative porin [Burkholderiales bacterium]
MRKSMLVLCSAAALVSPGLAAAQQAAAQAPYTLSANAGLFSQYVFRGLTQTNAKPALQGGFDLAHSSGLYAGTWASNVSWLADFGSYESSSLEWDFYGGYKGAIGASGFSYDVGLLQYYYPGTVASGATKANTLEGYGGVGWKWLTAKLSYSLGDKTFGVPDSRGTYYVDLGASYPATEKLSLLAHYGFQHFRGSNAGVSNGSLASYKDWKLGASYALPQSFTVGAYLTGTDMNATREAFYTTPAGKFVGKSAATAYLQKSF